MPPKIRVGFGSLSVGVELKQLRLAAGLTLDTIAAKLGVSTSTMSRMENGRREVLAEEVAAYLAILGVTGEQRDRLIATARGFGPGHLEASTPSAQSATFLSLESTATRITNFELLLVPGLAQTAEYARAVITAIQIGTDEHDVEIRVEHRLERQKILDHRKPPRLNLLVTELGLRQPIGGNQTMASQVRHLVDLAERPHIDVRVIPARVVMHPGLPGPFVILDYPRAPTRVHIEDRTTGLFLDEPRRVAAYRVVVEKLLAVALDSAESITLMESVASDLDGE